jgi:hypothetical protein
MFGSISQEGHSRVDALGRGGSPRAAMWLLSERTAEQVAWMVMLLTTIVSAEPWYRRPRRLNTKRPRNVFHRTVSFRNLFS